MRFIFGLLGPVAGRRSANFRRSEWMCSAHPVGLAERCHIISETLSRPNTFRVVICERMAGVGSGRIIGFLQDRSNRLKDARGPVHGTMERCPRGYGKTPVVNPVSGFISNAKVSRAGARRIFSGTGE